jgi:hypothetical protein
MSLNDSRQSYSKCLEMTLEELNGTSVNHLIDILDSQDVSVSYFFIQNQGRRERRKFVSVN